jgi:hypothetical protein
MKIWFSSIILFPLVALTAPSISELRACNDSLALDLDRLAINKRIDKDLGIIAEMRTDSVDLAANLNVYRGNNAFKIELPVYRQHCFTDPKKMIASFPDGDYCLHFKIACVLWDYIDVFEKMPSRKCPAGTDTVTANPAGASALAKLQARVLKNIEEQARSFEVNKRNLNDPKEIYSKPALLRYLELTKKFSDWDARTCISLDDPEIKLAAQRLKAKAEYARSFEAEGDK